MFEVRLTITASSSGCWLVIWFCSGCMYVNNEEIKLEANVLTQYALCSESLINAITNCTHR
jgi:hypothetical protein